LYEAQRQQGGQGLGKAAGCSGKPEYDKTGDEYFFSAETVCQNARNGSKEDAGKRERRENKADGFYGSVKFPGQKGQNRHDAGNAHDNHESQAEDDGEIRVSECEGQDWLAGKKLGCTFGVLVPCCGNVK
jgi:hypothetical protein